MAAKKTKPLVVVPTPIDSSNTSMMVADNLAQKVDLSVSLDTNDLIALYVTEHDAAVNKKHEEAKAERTRLNNEREALVKQASEFDYLAYLKKTSMGAKFIQNCKDMAAAAGLAWKDHMISHTACGRTSTSSDLIFLAHVETTKDNVKFVKSLGARVNIPLEPDLPKVDAKIKEIDELLCTLQCRIKVLERVLDEKTKERNARATITKIKLASMSGNKVSMPELIAKLQEGFANL